MVPNEREYPLYFGVYSTVLRDDGKFKMWYLATNRPNYDIGYAESEDGIQWKRLNVGKDGRDNFVFRGHGFSCFIDPNEKDPNHRYKGAYGPHRSLGKKSEGGSSRPFSRRHPLDCL